MAVTVTEYDQFKDICLQGLDWDSATLKVALFSGTHVPNSAESSFGNLTNECAGTGYTAGGEVVPTVAISSGTVTAGAISWSEITVNVRYVVLYASATIGGIVNPLLLIYDLGSELTLTTIPWSFSWSNDEILGLS